MKQMPNNIKNKIRQYAKVQERSCKLYRELMEMIEAHGVDVEELIAVTSSKVRTEALACINNGECDDIESSIKDIERVFLYYVNKGINDYNIE